MSQTERLLSNIREYYQLLGFLNEKHPQVLKEWSNGVSNATTNRTDAVDNPRNQLRDDYRDK
jgi:hypothetical protein